MSIIRPYKNAKIGDISSPFQGNETWRESPHLGVDFWFPNCYGTPLVAPEDCLVYKIVTPTTFSTDNNDPQSLGELRNGYGVLLYGRSGFYWLFWHCLGIFPVSVGENVPQGKIVAFLGNSGQVYNNGQYVPLSVRNDNKHLGAHLHMEKRQMVNGQWKYLDPLPDVDWALPVPISNLDLLSSIRITLLKMQALIKK